MSNCLYSSDGNVLLELINFELTDDYKISHNHCHNQLENSCIKTGSGKYRVENWEYEISIGDVFIFNNIEKHFI